MSKAISATPAVRILKEQKAAFTLHPYRYEEKGGAAAAAKALNAEERTVIKTLVMETDSDFRLPCRILGINTPCNKGREKIEKHV